MTLGKRIAIGIGACVAVAAIISLWGIYGVGAIVDSGNKAIVGNQLKSEMLRREVDHLNWANNLVSRLAEERPAGVDVQKDPTQCAFGKWFYGEGRKNAEKELPALTSHFASIEEPHRKLHQSVTEIDEILRTGKGRSAAVDVYNRKTKPELAKVRASLQEIAEVTTKNVLSDKEMVATAGRAKKGMGIFAFFAVLAGIAGGYSLTKFTVASLTGVCDDLGSGSGQVAAASAELSSSAQGLAEGSSEQAASLEETSSAMEEMSSMTKRNAESAGQAKSLADRAGTSVEKSNASMKSLVTSMAEISSMGEETGKIVKTIDEIAFQTNLLALNAAVEAARAGEAGSGFAVVADEVRNLAQRAATAAKNTSELIEGTIKKIKDGTVLVERTNADFGEVSSAVSKVTELVGEISASSLEQSRGIEEVSRAIGQMDHVTQGNAANAEEIASASEELSAQALSMQEVMRSLQALVMGGAGHLTRAIAAKPSTAAAGVSGRKIPPVRGGSPPVRAAAKPVRGAGSVKPAAAVASAKHAGGNGSGKPPGGNGKLPPGMSPKDLILEEKSMAQF